MNSRRCDLHKRSLLPTANVCLSQGLLKPFPLGRVCAPSIFDFKVKAWVLALYFCGLQTYSMMLGM